MKAMISALAVAFAMSLAPCATAKLPPPPPLDEKGKAALEEKKAKDAEAAEKTKAALGAAEDNAIRNFQANMKQAGKPAPKPVASAPAPAKKP